MQWHDLGGHSVASVHEYAVRAPPADVPAVHPALDTAGGDDLLSLLEAAGEYVVRRGEQARSAGPAISAEFWPRVDSADDPRPEGRSAGGVQSARAVPLIEPSREWAVDFDDYGPFAPANRPTRARACSTTRYLVRHHSPMWSRGSPMRRRPRASSCTTFQSILLFARSI